MVPFSPTTIDPIKLALAHGVTTAAGVVRDVRAGWALAFFWSGAGIVMSKRARSV